MDFRKVFFVLLFPWITEIFAGCCDCDKEEVSTIYSHCSLTVENLDHTHRRPLPSGLDSIPKNAFGIRLNIERKTEALCQQHVSHGFTPAAYAFSCDCGPVVEYLPDDMITSVQIITLRDFDAEHAAGSEVTDHFHVFEAYEFNTIANYLNHHSFTINTFLPQIWALDLLLMTLPSTKDEQQFQVRLTLSDGRELNHISPPVRLI